MSPRPTQGLFDRGCGSLVNKAVSLLAVVVAVAVVVIPSTAAADDRPACSTAAEEHPEWYSVVAVATHEGRRVILAVLSCSDRSGRVTVPVWRSRTVEVADVADLVGARLSADGTEACLTRAGGATATIELVDGENTVRPTWIPSGTAAPAGSIVCSEPERNFGGIPESWIESLRGVGRSRAPSLPPAGIQGLQWQFFAVNLDERLYFPILQFAAQESVWPSPLDTLERLTPALPDVESAKRSKKLRDRQLYGAYVSLPSRRENCTIYFRTRDFKGTWLVEYWLYYPLDVGGLEPHLHDSEHIFVEVDKLGGRVRRVVGAGHGSFAGNNIYDTGRSGAYLAYLPLMAFVELGKHASAGDIDRNGVFTPGIDENWYSERSKIWGVRDVIGTLDNQLLSYDASMTIPRRPEGRLGLRDWTPQSRYWPRVSAYLSQESCLCNLVPFVTAATASAAAVCKPDEHDLLTKPASAACARSQLTNHDDAKNPEDALKPWYFPDAFGRITYGTGPGWGVHRVSLNLVNSVKALRWLAPLRLPGRIDGHVGYWIRRSSERSLDGKQERRNTAQGVSVGLRYEQFLSNLIGVYGSFGQFAGQRPTVTVLSSRNADATIESIITDDGIRGGWYGAGIFFETRTPPVLRPLQNVTASVGLGFQSGGGLRVGFTLAAGLVQFGPGAHYGSSAGTP